MSRPGATKSAARTSSRDRPARAWRLDPERGSGTVLAVALIAVILVLGGVLGVLIRAQVARSGAQTAADLAALAAAELIAVPAGVVLAAPGTDPGSACRLAADVARRNGSSLARCTLRPGGVVQVTTSRPAGVGTATATARAAPS